MRLDQLIKKWHAFQNRFKGDINTIRGLLANHNAQTLTLQEIEKCKPKLKILADYVSRAESLRQDLELTDEFQAFAIDLLKSYTSAQPKASPRKKVLASEILEFKTNSECDIGSGLYLLSYLNMLIAEKYRHVFYEAKSREKFELIEAALKYVNQGIDVFNENEAKMSKWPTGVLLKKPLLSLRYEINRLAMPYLKPDAEDEFLHLFKYAREEKDPEKAYVLFQPIIELAKKKNELLTLFFAYHGQAYAWQFVNKKYGGCFVSHEDRAKLMANYKKMAEIYENAIKTLCSIPNVNQFDIEVAVPCDGIYMDLCCMADFLFAQSKHDSTKNDLESQQELLIEAQRLVKMSEVLPFRSEEISKNCIELKPRIEARLNVVSGVIAVKQKEMIEREKKEQAIKMAEEEYERQFDSMVNYFVTLAKPRTNSIKQPTSDSLMTSSPRNDDDEEDSNHTPVEEEEELHLIIADLKLPPLPKHKVHLSLEDAQKTLSVAKESNDIFQQIESHLDMASCLRD